MGDQNNNNLNAATEFWLTCIREWYPERHRETLFYSPLHFNRVPYSLRTVNGQTALVPQLASKLLKPIAPRYETRDWVSGKVFTQALVKEESRGTLNDSNIRDDQAVELLRHCVQALSKVSTQVMMTIFGLQFDQYLKDETGDLQGLITPASMEKKTDRRGDFDMLVIHRTHGLIVCEIKSIGAVHCCDRLQTIRSRLVKASEQLKKAKRVLWHLTEDLGRIPIRPSIFLPHVALQELRELLLRDSELLQSFLESLDTQNIEDTLEYFLCKDRIPPENILQALNNAQPGAKVARVEEEIRGLQDWWKSITRVSAETDRLTDDLYDHLLARFCGPATSVEVPSVTRPRRVLRTEGQAAAETSRAFAVLTLHEDQVRLLNDPDLGSVHLYGPPGTGKTLMLTLKSCEWLLQGKDVQVLNVLRQKRAVSFLIEKQLQDFVDKLRKSSSSDCNGRSNRAGLHGGGLPRGGQRRQSRPMNGKQKQRGSPVAPDTRTSEDLITAVDLKKVSGTSKDLITAVDLKKVSGTSKDRITAVDLKKVSGSSKDLITAVDLKKVSGTSKDRITAVDLKKVSETSKDRITAVDLKKVSGFSKDLITAVDLKKVTGTSKDRITAVDLKKVSGSSKDLITAVDLKKVSRTSKDRITAVDLKKVSETSKDLITAFDLKKVTRTSKDLITAVDLNNESGAACDRGAGTPELGEQSTTELLSRTCSPRVTLHTYDFLNKKEDLDKALREMVAHVRDGELYIIADEVLDLHCRVSLAEFCHRLKELVPRLFMWTVDTEQLKVKVSWVTERSLTIPLRTPPTVTREVQICKEISKYNFILPYTEPQAPVPTQGLPVKWLHHDKGVGHPDADPENCSLCAQSVARLLKKITSEKDCLQYRDIFVLCQNPYVDDDASPARHNGFSETARSNDVADDVSDLDGAASRTPEPPGKKKKTPYAVTQALRASHLPYRVVTNATATTPELRDLALAESDVIVVSDYTSVSGLERAVVVVFGHGCPAEELVKDVEEETVNDCGRFFTMSRCTGQLVWVGTPPL